MRLPVQIDHYYFAARSRDVSPYLAPENLPGGSRVPSNGESLRIRWRLNARRGVAVRRLSVVITNYNYERYVAIAIESALALRWDDVEVVVVDDGSTDGS